MEKILCFFEKAKNVNLPDFIDKYINGKLPKDYVYNYFYENENQICSYISICFTFDNLYYLVNGLKKDSTLFNANKKLSILKDEKKMNQIRKINGNKENESKKLIRISDKNRDKEQQTEVEIYYLYNSLEIDKNYDNLFLINNRIANFYIDIKKEGKNKTLSEKEKNIPNMTE